MQVPADLLVALAHRALEAASPDARRKRELAAIRELVLTEEDWADLRQRPAAVAELLIEKDRQAAIELGRWQGVHEWVEAVVDLATAATLKGFERIWSSSGSRRSSPAPGASAPPAKA